MKRKRRGRKRKTGELVQIYIVSLDEEDEEGKKKKTKKKKRRRRRRKKKTGELAQKRYNFFR